MAVFEKGRVFARVVVVLAAVASACGSSDDGGGGPTPSDAGTDGSRPNDGGGPGTDGSLTDGGVRDGAADASDAAKSDAGDAGNLDAGDAKVEIIPTYVKASNTRAEGRFATVALDGDTLAVGAIGDSSSANTINGNQADTSAPLAGAVYVFKRTGTAWAQQAYIKPSNNRAGAAFGVTVALSGDTLAVGAVYESSGSTTNQADTSAENAGAVYVFKRTGSTWAQEGYLKAAYPRAQAQFGSSLALKNDTLVVGATGESSSATGVGGDQTDTSAPNAGAAYVFTRSGTAWTQSAYLKASNTRADALFGVSAALDGDTIAVGALSEASNATGVNGNQNDTSAQGAGAAYVFVKSGNTWVQQAYVKSSNTLADPNLTAGFGISLSLSGNTLAVGEYIEPSKATGINGDQTDTTALNAGAVYVFTRSGTAWSQQAYVKPSNTRSLALFGYSVSLVGDRLLVGSPGESSNARYVNNDQADTSMPSAGAAYEFLRTGTTWAQTRYYKASNTRPDAVFGYTVSLATTGVAIGSRFETSNATGINGNQDDTSAARAGAVYVY